MKRLHLLVEGQTEETLADRVFRPYLEESGWTVSTSILTTKRLASGANAHGGVSKWQKIEKEIRLLTRSRFLTTMLDYYGFPSDGPGMRDRPAGDAYRRVAHVETAMRDAIANPCFLPHLVLHETEAWVFAAAKPLAELTDDPRLAIDLLAIADQAGGPELVNEGPNTAPSKRLQQRFPRYQKTLHGQLAVEALGIKDLRLRCPISMPGSSA